MTELRTYMTVDERAPFDEWLAALRDVQARARIRARLARVQAGNFGDFKPLQDGVQELRIDHGPGYQVLGGLEPAGANRHAVAVWQRQVGAGCRDQAGGGLPERLAKAR